LESVFAVQYIHVLHFVCLCPCFWATPLLGGSFDFVIISSSGFLKILKPKKNQKKKKKHKKIHNKIGDHQL